MKLTATAIKTAKPKQKPYKLFDGYGLYLEVRPNGSKRWRFKYRFEGKEKLISLGTYPLVTLKEAREKHHNYRKMVDQGINPSEEKKAKKAAIQEADTFKYIAEEWFKRNKHTWSENHAYQIYRRLERNVFPWLGKMPIKDITPQVILKVLRRVEQRGATEMAHRVKSNIGQVLRYGVGIGKVERDFTQDLKDALTPIKQKHHASITDPKKIGQLLREIDLYDGQFATLCALKLAPLTFVRPGELRHAEWTELDLEKSEWCIPAKKMKGRKKHIVPLSKQSLKIIEELRPVTEYSKYLFPSIRSPLRPMSNNAVTGALRRMGYSSSEMTGHGFRSMASTILNEQGYNSDHIERQLAHTEGNSVRAAYNYARHLPERHIMMQEWADYLDSLRSTGKEKDGD